MIFITYYNIQKHRVIELTLQTQAANPSDRDILVYAANIHNVVTSSSEVKRFHGDSNL